MEMAKIGHGQTRRQICEMEKDQRLNLFRNNKPGKDWWYAFLQRNPVIRLRTASALELSQASACTEETLLRWYIDFEQFLLLHDLDGKPDRIWNCDEIGFPLCPKSGKVLALKPYTVHAVPKWSKLPLLLLLVQVGGSFLCFTFSLVRGLATNVSNELRELTTDDDPMEGSLPNCSMGGLQITLELGSGPRGQSYSCLMYIRHTSIWKRQGFASRMTSCYSAFRPILHISLSHSMWAF